MYNLEFTSVEGISGQAALATPEFWEARKQNPFLLDEEGLSLITHNNRFYVVKVKDPLIEEYNERNRGSIS